MADKTPHRNLEAWKTAMSLVKEIYSVTGKFPKEERYGLVYQMRRAAVSVPSNIAEGAADRTDSQFINFLSTALGSLAELDTQIELSKSFGFIDESDFNSIYDLHNRTKALVFGLRKYLKNGKK